ncbi:MAG: DUF5009 domain-containing protein [Verrucomicrobia bacterium]|nr:DUF5009 domain-containing protein [Verrucomicrobiota bacterium]
MNGNIPAEKNSTQRLMSVDALRGFDMFWIVGAAWLVRALHQMSDNAATNFLLVQMNHARWAGMTFLDLIFPLFVFIMGVSTVFSLTKLLAQGGRREALKRIFKRSVLLYLAGIFYYGGLSNHWPNIRLVGVLNMIALCYLFGGVLFCYLKPRGLLVVTVSLLVGYWALLTFVPIRNYQFVNPEITIDAMANKTKPLNDAGRRQLRAELIQQANTDYFATTNFVTGKYESGLNLANHLDFLHLPGKQNQTFWDPQGLLCTLPSIASGLLGIFAGLLLQRRDYDDRRKVRCLVSFGLAGVALGWLWHLQFPVIKNIWSSSFVLVAGGYSALLLAAFYWLIEVKNWRAWCQPFVWIGANPITIYLIVTLVEFRQIASRFVGGDISAALNLYAAQGLGDLLVALVACALVIGFMRFLYRRKIFLRL